MLLENNLCLTPISNNGSFYCKSHQWIYCGGFSGSSQSHSLCNGLWEQGRLWQGRPYYMKGGCLGVRLVKCWPFMCFVGFALFQISWKDIWSKYWLLNEVRHNVYDISISLINPAGYLYCVFAGNISLCTVRTFDVLGEGYSPGASQAETQLCVYVYTVMCPFLSTFSFSIVTSAFWTVWAGVFVTAHAYMLQPQTLHTLTFH